MSQLSSQERHAKIRQLKINAAKAFMNDKHYLVAHNILETVDDPEADRLLKKLDLDPVEVDDPGPALLQRSSFLLGLTLAIGIICLLLGFFLGQFYAATTDPTPIILDNNSPQEQLELVIPTLTIDPGLDTSRTEVVATFDAYNMSLTATQAVLNAQDDE